MTRVLPQEPAERLSVWATYAHIYGPDTGGNHLRTALLVEILVQRYEVDVFEAIRLAREDWWDQRVKEAGYERDRLIEEARRRALAFEQDSEVSA